MHRSRRTRITATISGTIARYITRNIPAYSDHRMGYRNQYDNDVV